MSKLQHLNLPYISHSGDFLAVLDLENIWVCNLIHNYFNRILNGSITVFGFCVGCCFFKIYIVARRAFMRRYHGRLWHLGTTVAFIHYIKITFYIFTSFLYGEKHMDLYILISINRSLLGASISWVS